MGSYEVRGISELNGTISVQGSKNSVLPILAATIIGEGISKIDNCPRITDVYDTISIIEHLGGKTKWDGNELTVDTSDINCNSIPYEYTGKLRSSIIFLGALISRCKQAVVAYPGGCPIGERPIDIHIKGFEDLNIDIIEDDKNIVADAYSSRGDNVILRFPSVGATQNILLASVCTPGVTIIENAATEPEIAELITFLIRQGAIINGIWSNRLVVFGVSKLHGAKYRVNGDRIVASTFLLAAASVGGSVRVENIISKDLFEVNQILLAMGCDIITDESSITLIRKKNRRIRAIPLAETSPFPGIPTDVQSQLMVALSTADGTSRIKENIFENRFLVVDELNKLGADIIKENPKRVRIKGVNMLTSGDVTAPDLRGGAALVIAGMMCEGVTTVRASEHINRGYEDIAMCFNSLGADIIEKD